jgi:hypothetical protein
MMYMNVDRGSYFPTGLNTCQTGGTVALSVSQSPRGGG